MNVKLADRPVSSGASGPGARVPRGEREGRASWWAGWRVALRLARRDIIAHRGRSALVMVMIMLPVALMVLATTLYATEQVTVQERPESAMGAGQALITYVGPQKVQQSPDGTALARCDGAQVHSGGIPDVRFGGDVMDGVPGCAPAERIPGLVLSSPDEKPLLPPDPTGPLSRLVGGQIVPYGRVSLPLGADYGYALASVLVADARNDAFRGMVDLRSGRWPEKPGEVVVTDAGIARGLPDSGEINTAGLASNRELNRLTVVGTASAPKRPDGAFSLVTLVPSDDYVNTSTFILTGSQPVTWEQVQRLNDYGLVVVSRAVLADPPGAVNRIDGVSTPGGDAMGGVAFSAAILMLVVSCLVAGPAFAVLASRQRRMLALVAANGAPGSALRRAMIAQALILGAGAIALGVAFGIAGAGGIVATGHRFISDGFGVFDVPVWSTLGVAAVGVIACIVSAVVPARRLGELELARALAGEVVITPARRARPLLGGVLLGAGIVGCVLAVALPAEVALNGTTMQVLLMVAGIGAVVGGALMLVPTALVLTGRLGRRLPIAARMAARDASRLRGRATSTVAAVMAGALMLSSFGLLIASQDEFSRRAYQPEAPIGYMAVSVYEGIDGAAGRIASDVPGVVVRRMGQATHEGPPAPPEASAVPTPFETREAVLGILTPGCDVTTPEWEGFGAPCIAGEPQRAAYSVVTASLEDAAVLFGLDAAAVNVLRGGGAVVPADVPIVDSTGRITVVGGELRSLPGAPERTGWVDGPDLHALEAVVTHPAGFRTQGQIIGVVITPETARRVGADSQMGTLMIGPADSSSQGLTDEQALAVNRAAGVTFPNRVERGYVSSMPVMLWTLSGLFALLTVVATLTATALAMGEARRDLGTLAAVGAARSFRRRFAAWQTGGLALLGTLLGLLAGAVPGVVMSLATTTSRPSVTLTADAAEQLGRNLTDLLDGYLVVPWWPLLVALVVVPLVAALFGWLFAGGRVDMTRRMD